MNKSLQILLCIIVGLTTYIFFLLLYFPLDAIIGDTLSANQGGYRITYSTMEPSLIAPTVIHDFRLEEKNQGAFSEVFSAEQIDIAFSLFSLLSGSPNVHFESKLKKGNLNGEMEIELKKKQGAYQAELRSLSVSLEQVDLERLNVVKNALRGQSLVKGVTGVLEGEIAVVFAEPYEKSSASFDLKVNGLALKDLNIAAGGDNYALPLLTLAPKGSPAEFKAELDNGRFSLKKFNINGGDIELELDGSLNFGKGFTLTNSSMRGRFALSDMIFEKIPVTQIINSFKTADGYFPINVRGPAQKLELKIGTYSLPEYNLTKSLSDNFSQMLPKMLSAMSSSPNSTPKRPEQPEKTEQTVQPEQLTQPEKAEQPVEPEQPEQPEQQEQPEQLAPPDE